MSFRLVVLLAVAALASSATAQTEFNSAELQERTVFKVLQRVYAQWVSLTTREGVATLSVNGSDFVWAQGRLLPPEKAARWQDYAPQPFYPYPRELPDVASWSDDRIVETETRLATRRSNAPRRHSGFFDALWGIWNQNDAEGAQNTVRFLGFRVTVHAALMAPLARVEARLIAQRAQDKDLDTFLKGLQRLEGYNWRDIAETQSRSNHAYGIAIDLVPKSFGGKIPYWLWAPQEKPGWYRKAWANRWEPNQAVIQAFEAEGFIWGGKWTLFDTIHFEYRPEILALSGMR